MVHQAATAPSVLQLLPQAQPARVARSDLVARHCHVSLCWPVHSAKCGQEPHVCRCRVSTHMVMQQCAVCTMQRPLTAMQLLAVRSWHG